jgi:hypothetical protein
MIAVGLFALALIGLAAWLSHEKVPLLPQVEFEVEGPEGKVNLMVHQGILLCQSYDGNGWALAVISVDINKRAIFAENAKTLGLRCEELKSVW